MADMKIRVNLNDAVTATLNERGAAIWEAAHRSLGLPVPAGCVIREPLWEVMRMFGPHSRIGAFAPFFESNECELAVSLPEVKAAHGNIMRARTGPLLPWQEELLADAQYRLEPKDDDGPGDFCLSNESIEPALPAPWVTASFMDDGDPDSDPDFGWWLHCESCEGCWRPGADEVHEAWCPAPQAKRVQAFEEGRKRLVSLIEAGTNNKTAPYGAGVADGLDLALLSIDGKLKRGAT